MYRKINLWPYEAEVSPRLNPPVIGNRTIGKRAVTAIGRASVIHQVAIQILDANIALPSKLSVCGLIKKKNSINKTGPKSKPIACLDKRFEVLLIYISLFFLKIDFQFSTQMDIRFTPIFRRKYTCFV